MEEGFCALKEQTISWGIPHGKAENAEQLFSRETSTLGSGEPTGHSGTAVPKLHWPPSTPSAFISSLKPTQLSADLDYKHVAWKSSETSENMLKMWQEAGSTKWRFKCMDLEKWKGGMTIPKGKGMIARIEF